MAELVRYERRDGVALVLVDNPAGERAGPGVPEAIEAAIANAMADAAVRAVVLAGAGRTFVAGADIKVFGTLTSREQSLERSRAVHARFRRIEDSAKPLVAAIHGTALGGGLELAMACHFRVAVPSARVGQPEVLLGIIPGAGGTQRLPRLCGAAAALELCLEGQQISAERARELGIVDEVVAADRLLDDAVAFALRQAAAGRRPKTRERTEKLRDRDAALAACGAARERLKRGQGQAPRAAVDAVEAAVTLDFERAPFARSSSSRTASRPRSRARWCTCSSRSAKPRRSPACRRTRPRRRSGGRRWWARARWAPASRWRTPTRAYRCA